MRLRLRLAARSWATTICLALAQLVPLAAEPSTPPHLDYALEVRHVLQVVPGEQIVCEALAAEFNAKLEDGRRSCREWVSNAQKSLIFRVESQPTLGWYQAVLLGRSTELILKNKHWSERHRFDVIFGFDRDLQPWVFVLDNEPMVRTTAALLPEEIELFEYIPRGRDREILDLQARIQSAVVASLLRHVSAMRKSGVQGTGKAK